MSSSGSDGPRLTSALTYINKSQSLGGFDSAFVQGLGGIVLMVASVIIGIGEALATLVIRPAAAFSDVTAALIQAGFGAPARFLQESWNTAAVLLGVGPWRSLGPFVMIVAAGVVIGVLAMFAWYVDAIDADTVTGIDLPIIQRDVGGDMDDEN